MSLDDGLGFSLRGMPTTGAVPWQASPRSGSSPIETLGGRTVGSISLRGNTNAANGGNFQHTSANGIFTLYRYAEASIDKYYIDWPLETTGTVRSFTTTGSGGDDNGNVMFTVVRDGADLRCYTNGLLTDTLVGVLGSELTSLPGIGPFNFGGQNFAFGDLHSWSRALTDAEVLELYDAGFGGWPSSGGGSTIEALKRGARMARKGAQI